VAVSGFVTIELWTIFDHLSQLLKHYIHKAMFRKRHLRSMAAAQRKRVVDDAQVLLDVAKESADWFPPLESALGGMGALFKDYEVLVELVAAAHN